MIINNDILNVYLERRSSRVFVGRLYKKDTSFIFEYDKNYAYSDSSIPIGPDLPITKRTHKSDKLFSSFADRIPSKKNPAYIEYCQKFGISTNEKDEIILLSTIGKKGPSSFVFEIEKNQEYSSLDYVKFRDELSLTLRDFALVFSISLSTLQKLERNPNLGRDVLKRIEIYDLFPEVALFELRRKAHLIHSSKFEQTEKILLEKIEYNKKHRIKNSNNL